MNDSGYLFIIYIYVYWWFLGIRSFCGKAFR